MKDADGDEAGAGTHSSSDDELTPWRVLYLAWSAMLLGAAPLTLLAGIVAAFQVDVAGIVRVMFWVVLFAWMFALGGAFVGWMTSRGPWLHSVALATAAVAVAWMGSLAISYPVAALFAREHFVLFFWLIWLPPVVPLAPLCAVIARRVRRNMEARRTV